MTQDQRVIRRRSIAAATSILGVAVACSGSPTPLLSTPCGPGTTFFQGQCVLAQDAGAAADGESGLTTDGGQRSDATPESDARQDVLDGSASPGSPDAPPQSDPCPSQSSTFIVLQCDSRCPAMSTALCAETTCGPKIVMSANFDKNLPVVVRTPEAPGTDARCQLQCPSAGFVYGIGFDLYPPSAVPFVAWVDPPWTIVASQTPYCPDAQLGAEGNCIRYAATGGGGFFVMTQDPNAPARNVHFDMPAAHPCP